MKIERGLLATLGAATLLSAACAPATAGAGGGSSRSTVSLPSVTCTGSTLRSSALLDSAAVRMELAGAGAEADRNAAYAAAAAQARRAVEAEADNPFAYYVAGEAAARGGMYADAATFLARAEQLCPELSAEYIDQLQAGAAGSAFNSANGLLQAGDTTAAIANLQASVALDPNTYAAEFYLGLIDFQRQNTDPAVQHWRRVVSIIDALPADSSAEVNAQRGETRGNVLNALVLAGVQYLQREQNEQAATLLEEMTRLIPNSADATYHYALALYNLERWPALVQAGQRAIEVAPLNNGAWVLYYNGYAGQAQAASDANQTAQANEFSRQANGVRTRSQALPLRLERLNIDVGNASTSVKGDAVGTGRTAPVTVEFTLYGNAGTVGTGQVTITPPAADARQPFELTIANTAPITGYSYRVVP